MLRPLDYDEIARLIGSGADEATLKAAANQIRMGLHPHPVGQVSHSVPTLEDARLDGIQPKHRENLRTPTTEDYE